MITLEEHGPGGRWYVRWVLENANPFVLNPNMNSRGGYSDLTDEEAARAGEYARKACPPGMVLVELYRVGDCKYEVRHG